MILQKLAQTSPLAFSNVSDKADRMSLGYEQFRTAGVDPSRSFMTTARVEKSFLNVRFGSIVTGS